MPESMPMISRRPIWMLLATCALLSSGFSTMAAASQEGRWANGADPRLGELLLSQAIDASAEQSEPSDPSGTEEVQESLERPTLSLGSSGPLVIQVQVLLQGQDLYSGDINGDFDEATVAAVKAFQTANDIEPTGSVDDQTWGPLAGDIDDSSPQEEAVASQESELADGSSNSQLRLLIAIAALLGLGAGGFGLWKILAVPVPQPLAYPDAGDAGDEYEYVDELDGGEDYAPQIIDTQSRVTAVRPDSAITLPAAALERSARFEEFEEDLEAEERFDFSDLDETDLPQTLGQNAAVSVRGRKPARQKSAAAAAHPEKVTARQREAALQQAVVKDTTGQDFAQSKIASVNQILKEQSATDTAVAIATHGMKTAARRQASTTTAKKTARTSTPQAPQKRQSRASRAAARSKSGLAQPSRGAKAVRRRAGRATQAPPPPPPAPSEIIRATSAGALEQPELVTNPVMGRTTDIVATLITDLQGADPAKRRKAIWELGQRCDSRAIQPLVNMMTNSDSRQRSLILAALSEIGTQTLKPMKQALAISLQDENAEVRKNAIRDLTRIYDLVAQISHLLTSALDDPDPEVQDTARWALKQLNRIRANAGLEGNSDQPILQQSVSPPESFSGEETLKPLSKG